MVVKLIVFNKLLFMNCLLVMYYINTLKFDNSEILLKLKKINNISEKIKNIEDISIDINDITEIQKKIQSLIIEYKSGTKLTNNENMFLEYLENLVFFILNTNKKGGHKETTNQNLNSYEEEYQRPIGQARFNQIVEEQRVLNERRRQRQQASETAEREREAQLISENNPMFDRLPPGPPLFEGRLWQVVSSPAVVGAVGTTIYVIAEICYTSYTVLARFNDICGTMVDERIFYGGGQSCNKKQQEMLEIEQELKTILNIPDKSINELKKHLKNTVDEYKNVVENSYEQSITKFVDIEEKILNNVLDTLNSLPKKTGGRKKNKRKKSKKIKKCKRKGKRTIKRRK